MKKGPYGPYCSCFDFVRANARLAPQTVEQAERSPRSSQPALPESVTPIRIRLAVAHPVRLCGSVRPNGMAQAVDGLVPYPYRNPQS